MHRREFVASLAGVAASAACGFRKTANNADPPKLFFFGLTLFERIGGKLVAHLPLEHAHESFLIAPPSALQLLGGKPVNVTKAGLHEGHTLLTGDLYAWCPGVSRDATVNANSKNEAKVDVKLAARLPNLIAIAKKVQPDGDFKLQGLELKVQLNGGTLVEGPPSNCQGTKAGVKWTFYDESNTDRGAYNLTDVSAFQSEGGQLTLAIGAATLTLSNGESAWLINFPAGKRVDETPKLLEHADEWFDMIGLKNKMTATTSDDVNFIERKEDFRHPCFIVHPEPPPEDDKLARADGPLRKRFIPPDTDPCFEAALSEL